MLKTTIGINDDNFNAINNNNGIFAIDHTNKGQNTSRFQNIALITRNIPEALKNAEIIIVQLQTLYHESAARAIAPYFGKTTQMVLVIPGAMGSAIFKKHCKIDSIIFAEGESTPFDARIIAPGTVEILFQNVRNAIGVIPASKNNEGLAIAKNIYYTYCATRTNIIESALHNPNLIVHTIGVIMSASRIEYSKGEFWMYKEAFTPSIWNMIRQLDEEKCNVIKAYGGKELSYLEAARWRNSEDCTIDPMVSFIKYANEGSPKGPNKVNTRYITEDVPNGLVLMESLAKHKGIEVPLTTSLINIASFMLNIDYRSNGRTIERMGIEYMVTENL